MNIKQALKYKNKLAKKIQETAQKVARYNSVDEGVVRPYDVNELLAQLQTLTEEMVELKTKIHLANRDMYSYIFRLSELKAMVKHMRIVDCTEGVNVSLSRFGENPTSVKTSVISRLDMDNLIENLESEIDLIQDKLDIHNGTTYLN
jgi:seryl-tRNA synthetase